MGKKIRLLLVEDNPCDVELLLAELRRSKLEVEAKRVHTEADYLQALDAPLDLILSDCELPQFDGFQALGLLQARGLRVPFVFVSGMNRQEAVARAMQQGAAGFLSKDQLELIGETVRRVLGQTPSPAPKPTIPAP